jgi:hypothetical protein
VTGCSKPETYSRASHFGLVFVADIFFGINARNYPNRMQPIEFFSMLIRIIFLGAIVFATWFRVYWWRNEWIWTSNANLGFLDSYGVFLFVFETYRMSGKKLGVAYIRYACPWLMTRKYFKCPLLKARMRELYSLKGVSILCVGKVIICYTSMPQGTDGVRDMSHKQGLLCNIGCNCITHARPL